MISFLQREPRHGYDMVSGSSRGKLPHIACLEMSFRQTGPPLWRDDAVVAFDVWQMTRDCQRIEVDRCSGVDQRGRGEPSKSVKLC